jgi:hypothetical protein
MHRDNDSATTVIESNPPVRKRRALSIVPLCVVAICATLLIATVSILGAANKVKPGIAKSKYAPILSEAIPPEPMVFAPEQPAAMKFRHVIFRLGEWEIFRFTYEEGEPDDARESAHE